MCLAAKLSLSVKLLLITFACSVCASTEFKYSGSKKIETVIAANELNRIFISGGEVIEVIGDENKYSLYWSGDFRNLFIKPKIEVGETIELSLIIPQGGAQDIRFTVGDTAAQTIFINVGGEITSSLPGSGVTPSTNPQLKSEIALMMRAMIENEKGKYYVTGVKRTLQQTKERLITQHLSYRYRYLSGGCLSVKNLTAKPLNLLEADFSNLFKNTVAINFESNVIKPQGTIRIFIVTKEGEHD
ncbi:TraK superfamily protein (plasmid) [Candidatus Trichorickettsia mobilis]|nr:TraK superfamily protein [Candidatus Trichorickettsia mobilis]